MVAGFLTRGCRGGECQENINVFSWQLFRGDNIALLYIHKLHRARSLLAHYEPWLATTRIT